MLNLLNRFFQRPDRRRIARLRATSIDALESRLLLAAVLDSGTGLTIQLEQNERLLLSTDGDGTQFSSSNSVFTGIDLEDDLIFSGLGSNALSLNDLAFYDSVRIEAVGDGASVGFVDSGNAIYGHDLEIDMPNATIADMVVDFRGSSHLGDHDLTIRSNRRVLFWGGSELTTVNGDIDIQVRNTTDALGHAPRGVTLYEAKITSSGTGDILLDGKASDVVASQNWKPGVDIRENSVIESTSAAANGGKITLIGEGGAGRGALAGVFSADSRISSRASDIVVNGTAADGTVNFNVGVWLDATVIESAATNTGVGIQIEGHGGDGTDSGYGVFVNRGTQISSVDGFMQIDGTGDAADWASGVRFTESSVRATGIGRIEILGVAGESLNISHGVWLDGYSTLEAQSGRITVDGSNHQDSGNSHHGVELRDGSAIQSDTGHINITGTRTGLANGSGHAVHLWRRDDEAPVSIMSRSGNITVNAFGDQPVARLRMAREVTIGGSEMTGSIDLTADDFQWIEGGTVQSSGRLRINSANGSDLTLGGAETGNALTDDELAFLEDGFSRIEVGVGGSGVFYENLMLDGAVFHDPLTLVAAEDIVLSGGTALTAPSASLGGDVSIQSPHSATVEGDLVLGSGSSLSLHGITGGTTLTVNGRFNIGANVDLNVDWVPSSDDQPGASHVLVDRSSGSGSFSNGSESEIRRNLFGATVQYQLNQDPRIKLNIPESTSLPTTVVKLGSDEQDGVTTVSGAAAGDRFGQSVAAAGDMNGDGVPDLLVGATHVDRDNASDVGAAYLIYGSADWPSEFSVHDASQDVVTILGADVNDHTGRFVVADDLNGDGYNDLIIPANNADAENNQKGQSGDVAIIWGAVDLPAVIDLANLGSAGTIIYGADTGDLSGNPVEVIGDINGDDLPDLAIGAFWGDGPENTAEDVGEVHILFGRSVWPATLDLASDNESHITIYGEDNEYGHGDEFGVTIVGLGDVNGDYEDDFSIAAWRADGPDDDRPGAGATYVFFGGGDWDTDIDLRISPAADLVIHGAAAPDRAGWDSGGKGDVTGDGINDLVIATPLADSSDRGFDIGGAVLIPGSASLGGVIDLASPPAEATVILGSDEGDSAGRTSIVGDLNADGIDDLAVTARFADHPLDFGSNYGETYILLGRSNWPATIDLATPVDIDAVILGADNGDESGTMVRGIGDLNGDGQDEIAIGARYADGLNEQLEDAGEVAVVSGATLFDVTAPVATITTTYDAQTSASRLLFDVTFNEPVTGFSLPDVQVTDALGTYVVGFGNSASIRPLGDNSWQIDINRRTDSGSVTLAIQPSPFGSDLSRNVIDFAASSAATYVLSDAAPQIVSPEGTVSGIDTRLEWQAAWEARRYHYEIIRLAQEATTWTEGSTQAAFLESADELPIGSYRTWVRTEFEDGSFSPWASKPFQVSKPVQGLQVEAGLSIDRPTVIFDEVLGAAEYQVFVSNFTTGESGHVDTSVTENRWTASQPLAMGRHGIWVRGTSADGFIGQWSQVATYDVYPELQSLNATSQARPTLQWNAISGAASYQIYLSGGGTVVNQSGITATSYQVTSDAVVGDYRAWVRGVTSSGKQGPWSPVMRFSSGGRTQVNVSASAAGSAVPVFEWWSVDSAVDYEVYVSKSGTPGAYYRQAGITSEAFRSIPLPEGDYKVWVRSNLGAAGNAWSSGRSFTVDAVTSDAVAPVGLAPNGPVLNQQPVLSWSQVTAASGYEVLLRTKSRTELITGLTTSQYTPTAVITDEDSQWWVRAIDSQGRPSVFSESAAFNTSGRPVLSVVPTNNPVFNWTAVLGAERYILRVDNLTTGQSSMILEDQLIETTFAPAVFLPAGNFRAWVRAVSSSDGNLSPWSILVDFTV